MTNSQKIIVRPLTDWGIPQNTPALIAGPCSAESREQLRSIAFSLTGHEVHFMRAGIWKPRTRAGCFEGVGEEGLVWLKEIQEDFGLPAMVEVGLPEHAELALKHGIKAVWIGARTTVSPFAVQALSEVLQGTDIPVLVKNPMNPDHKLWFGAIERLARMGITKLAAIHRGFSTNCSAPYRNEPMWEIVNELRGLAPQLPIICDPSHICGRRDLLVHIALQAKAHQLNGLMIEVHDNPDQALSDCKQQVTPDQFNELLAQVATGPDQTSLLVRRKIHELDSIIIDLLDRRMELARDLDADEQHDADLAESGLGSELTKRFLARVKRSTKEQAQ